MSEFEKMHPHLNVRQIIPEKSPLKDIISNFQAITLFIGIHGGGNTWSVFMQPHSCFMELFGGDRSNANLHYHNLASLIGLYYKQYTPLYSFCGNDCLHTINQLDWCPSLML